MFFAAGAILAILKLAGAIYCSWGVVFLVLIGDFILPAALLIAASPLFAYVKLKEEHESMYSGRGIFYKMCLGIYALLALLLAVIILLIIVVIIFLS